MSAEFVFIYLIPFGLSYLMIGVITALPWLWSDIDEDKRTGVVMIILWPSAVIITALFYLLIWSLMRAFKRR
jgi:hypothetical protein